MRQGSSGALFYAQACKIADQVWSPDRSSPYSCTVPAPVLSLKTVASWPRIVLHTLVISSSLLICFFLSLVRLPGTEIASVGVNWFLIWVVSWSLKRSVLEGAIAGLVIGLVVDGLTTPEWFPTHIIGFVLVGCITALLQKERYLQEDFVSVALIVFGMAVIFETAMAVQFSIQAKTVDWLPYLAASAPNASQGISLSLDPVIDPKLVSRVGFSVGEIWTYHQRLALASAIVSSLWAPILYYPLNRFWQWMNHSDRSSV